MYLFGLQDHLFQLAGSDQQTFCGRGVGRRVEGTEGSRRSIVKDPADSTQVVEEGVPEDS